MVKVIWCLCFSLLVLTQYVIAKPVENNINESPDKIGELLVYALENDDFSALDERFDRQAFAEKMIDNLKLEKNDAELMRKKIIETINLELIFRTALNGIAQESITAKLINIDRSKNIPVPIIRMNVLEGGCNYYELSLYKNKGQYYIDDIFVITSGQYISESMGQAMTAIFSQSSGWFSNFNINHSEMESISKILDEATQHKKNGDAEASYNSFKKLPEYITDNDTIHLALVMSAFHLDESIYRNELSAFAKKHDKNPRYTFMLIDHYTYMEEYDQAVKNIDLLLVRYQKDAALITMKANVYFLQKNYKDAQSAAISAIEYEPDFEEAYWIGVTAALADKQYQKAVEWLEKFEDQFGYDFTVESFQDQEIYKGFIKSKDFKLWMKSKQA